MPDILLLLETSQSFFLTSVFVVSLMVGSFLNVVIYRLPVMMERSWKRDYQSYFHPDTPLPEEPVFNLVKPDSTCPKCGHKIRPWENIPVISWLWLRGRCSNCQTPIPVRYPAVELLTAVLSVVVAWQFGYGMQSTMAILLTWSLVAMTFIDLDKMLLPDQLTLPMLWLGLLLSLNNTFVSPVEAIIGAAAGYMSLWSVYWGFKLLTGKEGMGFGDFKLLGALGAWLGWHQLPVVILLSSLVGAIIGTAYLAMADKEKSQPIPFGPYLAIAGWISLLYGDWIVAQYWEWILQ